MFDVIQEIMNTEQLDHLSIEDQMLVLDIVADSIKRYKAIELDVFLNMYMMNIIRSCQTYNLPQTRRNTAIQGVQIQSLGEKRL